MERSAWTDRRLDDMVARIDSQFDLLRTEIREMRIEMRDGFRGINDRIDHGSAKIERRIDDTRRDMFHGAIAIFGSIVAVLAVLLAQAL